jgi:arsenite-transporting ATPase
VLVVSSDPAHSLADALAIELSREPRPIHAPELHAAELDADRALTRWLKERDEAIRTIANRGTYLDEEDIDRFLSLSFPGVDELVGLIELVRLSRTREFDEVVIDTAPTGHTLRLLQMPETLARLAQVFDDMHAKHRFLASSLGGSWNGDFADQAIADIEREAAELRALLERASFTWVTLPEELPFRESEHGVRALTQLGMKVGVIVVNRVWPEPDRACAFCSPRVEDESTWRRRIVDTFGDRHTVLEVPARIEEPRGVDALFEVAASVRVPGFGKGARKKKRSVEEFDATIIGAGPAPNPIAKSVKLVIVGGKGGVGKTTVAAAMAIELAEARPEARVLVLSTDPAHSLGDALDHRLSDQARTFGGPENLRARELDAVGAWEVERQRYRESIEDLFSSIFRGRMDATFDRAVMEDLLDLAPPGIDELFAIVSILDALVSEDPQYDLVVLDTAPTGHTLRLLALPEKALEWVHALMSVLLKYRNVVGLGELASDLTDLARRLRALIALLRDPARAAFVIVTRPAELPRLETERLARDLRHLHVPIAAIVANAVTQPGCSRCAAAAELEKPELDRLEHLAPRVARFRKLLVARAVYPAPRGPAVLRLWRDTWSCAGYAPGS